MGSRGSGSSPGGVGSPPHTSERACEASECKGLDPRPSGAPAGVNRPPPGHMG